MSDPLYKKELLRLAADAHGAGRLAGATATGHAHNPICGDKVVVDLVLEDGRISEIRPGRKSLCADAGFGFDLGKEPQGCRAR